MNGVEDAFARALVTRQVTSRDERFNRVLDSALGKLCLADEAQRPVDPRPALRSVVRHDGEHVQHALLGRTDSDDAHGGAAQVKAGDQGHLENHLLHGDRVLQLGDLGLGTLEPLVLSTGRARQASCADIGDAAINVGVEARDAILERWTRLGHGGPTDDDTLDQAPHGSDHPQRLKVDLEDGFLFLVLFLLLFPDR